MKHLLVLFLLIMGCDSRHTKTKNESNEPIKELKKATVVRDSLIEIEPKKPAEIIDTASLFKYSNFIGKYPFSSQEILSREDLMFVPPSILRIMRNEIFARRMYRFNDQSLLEYFKTFTYYKPLFSNVDKMLNEIERKNIHLIKSLEKENEEISYKELLSIFTSNLNNQQRNFRGLSYLFGDNQFESYEYLGSKHVLKQVFKHSRSSTFLLQSEFYGCNECDTEYWILEYGTEGDFLRRHDVCKEYSVNIKYSSDTITFNCDPYETTPHNVKAYLDKNEKLIIQKEY